MRVGIPRSLLYYRFYPFWRTFLEALGAEVRLSPLTNRAILLRGVELAHTDTCLPVKVAFGHVDHLKDKVDFLFVPYVIRLEPKRWVCPKIIGFPDMLKATISDLPPIIAPTLDVKQRRAERSYYGVGRRLTGSRGKIKDALKRAKSAQEGFEQSLLQGDPPLWLDRKRRSGGDLRLGIVSHPYITYDHFLNLGLLGILEKLGVDSLTMETVDPHVIDLRASSIRKRIYYTFGKANVGAAFHFLNSAEVDGLIYLLSFSCGPDSLLKELIDARARSSSVPYMSLILDEHSGIGGVETRVEAFVDMVRRRR
jgi:predicted nucleotide-binding protein (sugar kinase/HSP70/actin superfamily)